MSIKSIIIGTGSYIPPNKVPNSSFLQQVFYESNGEIITKPTVEIIEKFEEITEIKERRYVSQDLVTSDIAYFAAKNALESSHVNPETIDYIIVANNFGDVDFENRRSTMVPSLASKVKHMLGIKNPKTIAFDIMFGCPGWLQGMIIADSLISSGNATKVLVIGAEILSRISDPHDRDSMIYADGAGATILQGYEIDEPVGILSYAMRSDTLEYANMLRMGISYNPQYPNNTLFLKMDGNKLFQYAMDFVPLLVKEAMDKADISLNEVSKFLFHQANAKMDYGFLGRTAELYGYGIQDILPEHMPKKKNYGTIGKSIAMYGIRDIPAYVMPMTIHEFGNSSVATIPTLLDRLVKNKLPDHKLKSDNIIVFASVGAGMNINAMVYRMP
ncbi:MAG: 3-oxoacyl-[acyl-carrier-protein] synthase III C-terminal domain-containing protein [bacterium]